MVFRQAKHNEIDACYALVDAARRKMLGLGRKQWTEDYPSRAIIAHDVDECVAFILEEDGRMLAYGALVINGEPAYEQLQGRWVSEGLYIAVHRLAVDPVLQGKGIGREFLKQVERYSAQMEIPSIKIDTNMDNREMIGLLSVLGYVVCGTVDYGARGKRMAFEKYIGDPNNDPE